MASILSYFEKYPKRRYQILNGYELKRLARSCGAFSVIDGEAAEEYDTELIELLRRGGVLDAREILAGLGIDPRDSATMQLISTQLEELRRFGLVQETAQGWRWR